MKASQFFILTYKEAPAEAEVVSHKLLLRAGMIRRVSAGIYTYMPMGLRVLHKISAIVREEMDRAGAIELSMPIVQPAELWQETDRLDKMGEALLRLQDRHARNFVLQPTSEEVVTDIARQELRSYRQLPRNFYQIQTKFRDERRPRFGLMRGREFVMKDAYSFDKSPEDAKKSYDAMSQAYQRIFDRFGLRYRAVAADSGDIGGELSQEFQVIAATGEDAIVYCPNSDYAANMEKAQSAAPSQLRVPAAQSLQKTPTPGKSTCAQVAAFLRLPITRTVKSLVLATDNESATASSNTQLWLILLRGDHEMNEVKVGKLANLDGFRFASEAEIDACFGSKPGYLGPVNIQENAKFPLKVIADREVVNMSDWVCGANEPDYHFTGVNWGRDLPEPDMVADIRNVVAGDPSPDGQGVLAIERGIEIGHIFYLGTKYSKAMKATFLDESGSPSFFEMGCYGLGVTRVMSAAIEQNNDTQGIIWPDAIAPFTAVICPIGMDRSAEVREAAKALYEQLLAAGVDVILDDRPERPGVMFAEWELIGVPHRFVVSLRNLKEGVVEYQKRQQETSEQIAIGDAVKFLKKKLQT